MASYGFKNPYFLQCSFRYSTFPHQLTCAERLHLNLYQHLHFSWRRAGCLLEDKVCTISLLLNLEECASR
jgi:hypothetical protein